MKVSRLALLGGEPLVSDPNIWPQWPIATGRELGQVQDVLDRGRWTIRSAWRGAKSKEQILCEELAEFAGSRHACSAQSGTAALILVLEAMDIGWGDEVVIPGLTWIATATAVLHVGATPVFADVDATTLVLDPAAFAAAVTPKTKAVIPVHWHGQIADMDPIMEVAKAHGIRVLEDCAQAPGGRYKGCHVGTIGDAGAFSLHNDKLLTAGEGGLILTDDTELWQRMQARRLDGFIWSDVPLRAMDGWFQEDGIASLLGMSNTMSEFQAAVAIEQLRSLGEWTDIREKNGERLCGLFGEVPGFDAIPRQAFVTKRPFYEFTIRCDPEYFRDVSIETLAWATQAEVGFPVYPEGDAIPVHPSYHPEYMKRYSHLKNALRMGENKIPVSLAAARHYLTFLHPPLLASDHIPLITQGFRKVAEQVSQLRGVNCDDHGELLQ